MGFIYKITNKINGKVYIGQTITPIKNRMYKHYSQARNGKNITGIDAAIKKYGKENFEVEQILECPNEDLDLQEKFYISKYNSFENGYNLTIGGQLSTTSLNLQPFFKLSKFKCFLISTPFAFNNLLIVSEQQLKYFAVSSTDFNS